MFKKSGKTRRNRNGRFTFETMERRELMTANLGMAMEPIEAPVAAVAAPVVSLVGVESPWLNNNTMASASPMGTVSTSVSYRGSIGGTDPVDYWKFRVANSGLTTIQLTGMSRDVNIQILDSSNRVLASGIRGGLSAESVAVNLQAGQDYFIKVYPYTPPNWLTVGFGPVSSYQLSVNAPIPASVDPDPFTMPLGTVSTSVTRNGSVGGADPVDWFKFQVANSGATTIRLAGMSRDVDIKVVDANGRELGRSELSGTSAESLTLNLQAGVDYFIKVYPFRSGSVSNYQLSVNAPVPASVDPDPFTMPLGTVSTSVTRNGSVGGADPVDWFKFQVANSGATTIRLAGMSRDVDIKVVDANGRELGRSELSGTSAESLTLNLQAGVDYFIKVYPDSSGPITNYQLSVTASNAPTASSDDTLATANPLGSFINATRTAANSVGSNDWVDYYSFTPLASRGRVLEMRSVTISLTGMSDHLNLEVLDSSGNVLYRARNHVLNLSLTGGLQYFIRVSPRSSVISNYLLSVTA